MSPFYFGLTGFAAAWFFRRDLHSGRDILMKLVLPLLGGIMFLAAFIQSLRDMRAVDYGSTSFEGVGTCSSSASVRSRSASSSWSSGRWWRRASSEARPSARETEVLVPDDTELVGVGLPDSPTRQHLVIPPDDLLDDGGSGDADNDDIKIERRPALR